MSDCNNVPPPKKITFLAFVTLENNSVLLHLEVKCGDLIVESFTFQRLTGL